MGRRSFPRSAPVCAASPRATSPTAETGHLLRCSVVHLRGIAPLRLRAHSSRLHRTFERGRRTLRTRSSSSPVERRDRARYGADVCGGRGAARARGRARGGARTACARGGVWGGRRAARRRAGVLAVRASDRARGRRVRARRRAREQRGGRRDSAALRRVDARRRGLGGDARASICAARCTAAARSPSG